LELEVEDPWTIHYLKWHSEAGIEEEEEVCSITDADTVIGLIEWFAKRLSREPRVRERPGEERLCTIVFQPQFS